MGTRPARRWLTQGSAHFRKTGAQWTVADGSLQAGLHKRHGLQGPIDDAFLDSFVFVSPTGSPIAPAVGKWTESQEARASKEWRREFRGEAQVRRDVDVSDLEIAGSNLILWGDPSSNKILRALRTSCRFSGPRRASP
jgi:hypothetical protein